MNWTVTLDEFDDATPFGMKRFTNIIATLNPNARRRLIFAAHYDSKYFPDDGSGRYFLAATDSAIPCAMLVEIARVVTPLFRARVQEQNMAEADDDVSHCKNEHTVHVGLDCMLRGTARVTNANLHDDSAGGFIKGRAPDKLTGCGQDLSPVRAMRKFVWFAKKSVNAKPFLVRTIFCTHKNFCTCYETSKIPSTLFGGCKNFVRQENPLMMILQ